MLPKALLTRGKLVDFAMLDTTSLTYFRIGPKALASVDTSEVGREDVGEGKRR